MRIQTAILFVLVSALTIMTLVIGIVSYAELHATILGGFDGKLSAISTVTGGFVRGEEHDQILLARRSSGYCLDPQKGKLWAFDPQNATFMTVDTAHGGADVLLTGLPAALSDLAWQSESNRIIYQSVDLQLIALDPAAQEGQAIQFVGQPLQGMAFSAAGFLFASSGNSLLVFDQVQLAPHEIMALPSPLLGLSPSAEAQSILGIDDQGRLLSILPSSGSWRWLGSLIPASTPESSEPEPLPVIAGLACNGTTLYTGGDRLILAALPLTGEAAVYGTFGFRNESSPTYLKYVGPMREIKAQLNLTYMYSQLLTGPEKRRITYVLDANQDDEHSAIGDDDPDPADDATVDVQLKGAVHQSEIIAWQDWGLLKSGFAPLYYRDGRVAGMTGADVNVSIIEQKTRVALLRVLFTGGFFIVFGSIVAVSIVRRLTRPLDQLKESALRVAAGHYGQEIQVKGPQELTQLSSLFNRMSHSLRTNIHNLKESNLELEKSRLTSATARTLRKRNEAIPLPELFAAALQNGAATQNAAAGREEPHAQPEGAEETPALHPSDQPVWLSWIGCSPFVAAWSGLASATPQTNRDPAR
jgi:HAMP domain-containing protein